MADRWQIKKSKNIKTELNERQQKAIDFLLEYGKITNEEYGEINSDIMRNTASNDLKRRVNNTDQGNRIGPDLVELVIKNALRLSQKIGLRYLTVDAYFQNKWFMININLKYFQTK